jgi:F0F1-type ATP synthase assembly protein I
VDVEDKPSPGPFDLLSIGLSSALMIGLGLGIGIAIDDWLHSSPVATLLGLAFGIVAAVGSTVRWVRKFM